MSEKMNIGPEIRPEIRELKKGSIVENVTFEMPGEKSKTFKSSSPDRKIIVLDDKSVKPLEGKTYRVKILTDTSPEDPTSGKLIAKIMPEDDLSIAEDEKSVSYLGVSLEKSQNRDGMFVPDREKYADYVNDTEVALPLQRDIAVSFLTGDPIAVESGTSFGKTTTVRKMASELGYEVHYINLNGATDVEDLMGRYIPNPNKSKPEDPEYIFADGKVTSGLRQEEGKTKVIILDEFNSSAPNILIRLHEVLDALERGGNVILSEDASETIKVSKQKTKVVALMNPPGQGFLDRKPLDPAQLRRWVYKKMPTELPDNTFRQATEALFGIGEEAPETSEDMFLRSREEVLSMEQLGEVPGIKEIMQKYFEFHKTAKELVKNRRIAEDQPQSFTFDDREEPKRVRDFVLRFYNGDINETFQKALKYYYVNKIESDTDRKKLEEIVRLVEVKIVASDSKRKGLEDRKAKKAKEESDKKKKDAEERAKGEKSKEGFEKIDDEISELEDFTRKKMREMKGESLGSTISAEHKTVDRKGLEMKETITIDFEKRLDYSIHFYKSHGIELLDESGFMEKMRDIWERNSEKMREEIEKHGFDEILLIPDGLNTADVHEKMSKGYTSTYEGSNFSAGGSFGGVIEDRKAKIVLIHKSNAQNLKEHKELAKTLGKSAEEFISQGEKLSLTEYLIYQKQYFEVEGRHLDADGWTWLPGSIVPSPAGGSRVVDAYWSPDSSQLDVDAHVADVSGSLLGCRLSRSFF